MSCEIIELKREVVIQEVHRGVLWKKPSKYLRFVSMLICYMHSNYFTLTDFPGVGKKGEGFACMERTLFNSRDDPIPPPLEARAK